MNAHLKSCAITTALVMLAACGGGKPAADAIPQSGPAAAAPVPILESVDLQPGTGAAITAGQTAVVQYTGWLYETSAPAHQGKEFDSSRNAGQPFRFHVGRGEVIKGWDQGVLGMKAGGRRRLTIPPELAYGDVGAGGVIPPGATLIFDVELTAIE